MINEQLQKFYNSKSTEIHLLAEPEKYLDGPLLMKCWENEYDKADVKILFVGQECNGWLGYVSDDIEEGVNTYEEFKLSKNGNRSVFWQYVYRINSLLNPRSPEGNNFLWTNVSKFSTLDGEAIEWSLFQETIRHFNCLSEEIAILNPDVVLFLSGPHYDEKIKLQFEQFPKFQTVFDEIPIRELAKVDHPDLPKHTYRTYHPSSLQRQNKSNYIDRLVELILLDKKVE